MKIVYIVPVPSLAAWHQKSNKQMYLLWYRDRTQCVIHQKLCPAWGKTFNPSSLTLYCVKVPP